MFFNPPRLLIALYMILDIIKFSTLHFNFENGNGELFIFIDVNCQLVYYLFFSIILFTSYILYLLI